MASAERRLWRRWVVATTLGELLGFSVPATTGAVAYALDAPVTALYPALVLAGGAEGALLALGQSFVLRRHLAGFDRRAWCLATAAAAAFAWSIGLLPSSLGDRLDDLPVPVLVVAGVALASALLLSLGVAQWWVLRRYVARAAVWIPANVLAWTLGLAVSVTLLSVLLTEETGMAAAVAIGAGAGLLMGLTVAAVTGWFLVRLVGGR